jgi:hypothetical protein
LCEELRGCPLSYSLGQNRLKDRFNFCRSNGGRP